MRLMKIDFVVFAIGCFCDCVGQLTLTNGGQTWQNIYRRVPFVPQGY